MVLDTTFLPCIALGKFENELFLHLAEAVGGKRLIFGLTWRAQSPARESV